MTIPSGLNLVIAILAFAAFIIPLKELITNGKGKISERGWYLFIVGISILILTCIKSGMDETKEIESNKLAHKMDSMQGVINSKQLIIDSKQDLINSKQDSIDKKQNEIKSKSADISKLQAKLIDTTQMVAGLAIKNSELQEELLRMASSSKSFPLLTAAITNNPKFQSDDMYPLPGIWRVVFKLNNGGEYDLSNIKIKYIVRRRHSYSTEGQLGEFHLAGRDSIEIMDINLHDCISTDFPLTYTFFINWKTYNYQLLVVMPITDGTKKDSSAYSLTQQYNEFKNKDVFIDSMLKEIK